MNCFCSWPWSSTLLPFLLSESNRQLSHSWRCICWTRYSDPLFCWRPTRTTWSLGLCYLKSHYRVYNSPSRVPVPSILHRLIPFLYDHFNIILSYTCRCCKRIISFKLSHKIPLCTNLLFHSCQMFHPSHPFPLIILIKWQNCSLCLCMHVVLHTSSWSHTSKSPISLGGMIATFMSEFTSCIMAFRPLYLVMVYLTLHEKLRTCSMQG